MQLVEVERVDSLFGSNQDVLVVGLWMDPRGRAMDTEGTAIENLKCRKDTLENAGKKLGSYF